MKTQRETENRESNRERVMKENKEIERKTEKKKEREGRKRKNWQKTFIFNVETDEPREVSSEKRKGGKTFACFFCDFF